MKKEEEDFDKLDEYEEFDELIGDSEFEEEDSESILDDEEEQDQEQDDIDIMFKFNVNNHKIDGKHALKRDTIFKGKLDSQEELIEEHFINSQEDSNNGITIEAGTSFEFESRSNEEYITRLKLSQDVYDLLNEYTELDFSSNRRKPNKQAFNDYYRLLLDNIGKEYTKSEIFVELSYYFTDNIFNMFKLLDKEYATQIIIELKQSGYLSNLNNINFI